MRYSSVSRVQGGDFPVFSENTTRPLTQRESGGHDRKRGLKERFSPSIPLIAVFKIWLEIRHVGRTLLYRNNSLLPPMGGGHRGQAVSPRCGCDFYSRSWNGCFWGWGNGTKNTLKRFFSWKSCLFFCELLYFHTFCFWCIVIRRNHIFIM